VEENKIKPTGGTLEIRLQASEQNSPKAETKEKAAEMAADFITTFLPRTGRCTRNARVPDKSGPILADLLFGHDQGVTATKPRNPCFIQQL
jgi:hypothetical protein